MIAVTLLVFSTLLRDLSLPIGALTAPVPPSALMIRVAEPSLLAALCGLTLHSGMAMMESASSRRITSWHMSAHASLLSVTLLVVSVQGPTAYVKGSLVVATVGYHAIVMIGTAVFGTFGSMLSLVFAFAVVVMGVDGVNHPAWWAWPLQPDIAHQAAIVLLLWLAGAAALIARQSRRTGLVQE